jgi:hypothetical protein
MTDFRITVNLVSHLYHLLTGVLPDLLSGVLPDLHSGVLLGFLPAVLSKLFSDILPGVGVFAVFML